MSKSIKVLGRNVTPDNIKEAIIDIAMEIEDHLCTKYNIDAEIESDKALKLLALGCLHAGFSGMAVVGTPLEVAMHMAQGLASTHYDDALESFKSSTLH